MAEFHPVRESLLIVTASLVAGGVALLIFPDRPRLAIAGVLLFLLFVFIGLGLYIGFRGVYSMRRD